MPDFVVNIYELRITPVGERVAAAVTFRNAAFDSIKVADHLLLDLTNKVRSVMVKREKTWAATTQSTYLLNPKRDAAKGEFYGQVEVGSAGSFDRLRHRSGSIPYKLNKVDDLPMREFFFRLEVPPKSSLGFLVVQRLGRYTAANALQQAIRHEFNKRNHTAHFRLLTDAEAFREYLTGRIEAVRAKFVPRDKEAREVVKRSVLLGTGLRPRSREDVDIKLKVQRPITAALKEEIVRWLVSDQAQRPQIVTLPVTDEPDKIILCVQNEAGRRKQLHPDMIADMGLAVDRSDLVTWSRSGELDLTSANKAAADLCDDHRAALTT